MQGYIYIDIYDVNRCVFKLKGAASGHPQANICIKNSGEKNIINISVRSKIAYRLMPEALTELLTGEKTFGL